MNLVNLEAAVKAYGERVLLDRVSLGVAAGDRIGVVGRNGSGKTTLLAALAGAADLNSGRSTRARDATVGYLPQVEQLTGQVREIVFGALPEHEWATDARARGLLAALLVRHRPRRRGRAAVRRRTPPGRARGAAARDARPAAARRADQPSGHRGDRLAGRVPGNPGQGSVRRGHARPVVPRRGLRPDLGDRRRPGARLRRRLLRVRAGQGRASQAGGGARPAPAQPAPQGTRLAAARPARADQQAEVQDRGRDGADRRRARAAGRRRAVQAGGGAARQDRDRPDRRDRRDRRPHAARRRELAARPRRPGRRRRRQRQREDHAAATCWPAGPLATSSAGRSCAARPCGSVT